MQRNLTPGGDKNGADINLALDALEMAFTHTHISGYVIVGGDSDFISLVEKLKQYDKQIFVVGGRSFTSQVMQRNCHEFIAYENLIGGRGRGDRGARGPAGPVGSQAPIEQVMPLDAARPQDAERPRGHAAARPAEEHAAAARLDVLGAHLRRQQLPRLRGEARHRRVRHAARESGRNILVELKEDGHHAPIQHEARPPQERAARSTIAPARRRRGPTRRARSRAPRCRCGAEPPRMVEAIAEVRRLFQSAQNPPRWPMYVRQVKQFLRGVDPTFDERKFGFASLNDLLRGCQKDGLFRMERDRQGVVRFFQGNVLKPLEGEPIEAAEPEPVGAEASQPEAPSVDARDPEIVDGDVLREVETTPIIDVDEGATDQEPEPELTEAPRGRRRRPAKSASAAPKAPKEKKPARPRAPRRKAPAAVGV